jgi:hypothetical protein
MQADKGDCSFTADAKVKNSYLRVVSGDRAESGEAGAAQN